MVTTSPPATTTPTAAEPSAVMASGSPEVLVPPTEAVEPTRKAPAQPSRSAGSAGSMRGAGPSVDTKQEAFVLPSSVPPPPIDPIVQAVQEGMKERERRGE
jgi:hypothetical protein